MKSPRLTPFSLRHREALRDKTIELSLKRRLRKRIWLTLEEYDYPMSRQAYPYNSWDEPTYALVELPGKLKKYYGSDKLEAYIGEKQRGEVGLPDFIMGCYPDQVFDVVEVFNWEIGEKQHEFQQEINAALQDEACPWILCDGYFLHLDSRFLEEHVLGRVHDLLASNSFEGALQEFVDARNDLVAGDNKSAVLNAAKAFESTLKTIVSQEDGNASSLIKELENTHFYDDLPDSITPGFGENVLMALPYIRNRFGGHGQGASVVEIPRSMSELSVHLAGTLILFLVKRHLELTEVENPPPDAGQDGTDNDDLPF